MRGRRDRLRPVLAAGRRLSPAQAAALEDVAARLGASARQVALAWLLHRSPNILLIPGTSSEAHLRENVDAANLALPVDARAALNAVSSLTQIDRSS